MDNATPGRVCRSPAGTREEAFFPPFNFPPARSPMTEQNLKVTGLLTDLPTCRVRGRPGRFSLLKLLPVKARVLPTNPPEGRMQLVTRADLEDTRAHANSLFAEPAEPCPPSAEEPH